MRVKENKAHREAKEARREINVKVQGMPGYYYQVSIDGLPSVTFGKVKGMRATSVLVDDLNDRGRMLPEDRLALEQVMNDTKTIDGWSLGHSDAFMDWYKDLK